MGNALYSEGLFSPELPFLQKDAVAEIETRMRFPPPCPRFKSIPS